MVDEPNTQRPRRTNKPPEAVNLTGLLFAFFESQPTFLNFGGSEDLYLVCCADADTLRDVMRAAGANFDSIKQIVDAAEFLSSVPNKLGSRTVRIAVNPRYVDGRYRWVEIQRSE